MHVLADRVDNSDHLVSWNPWILNDREQALDGHHIAVTDAARLDANAHFLRARGWNVPLFRHERAATLSNHHRAHFRHCWILSIEMSSRPHIGALGLATISSRS